MSESHVNTARVGGGGAFRLPVLHANAQRLVARIAMSSVALLVFACTGDLGSGAAPDETDGSGPQTTPGTNDAPDAGPLGPTRDGDEGDGDEGDGDGDGATGPSDRGVCSRDQLCWELPSPQGHDLNDAFARSAEDVWSVGAFGTILHYDGQRFTRHPVETTADLRGVHASGADNVWVVGEGGVVLQYNGSDWRAHDVSAIVDGSKGNGTGDLFDVFTTGPDAVWVVGHSGVAAVIGYYDGSDWHDQSLMADTDRSLRAIWGSREDDLWAAGDDGVIRHFDGAGWLPAMSPTGRSLRAIHGSDSDNVFMVGDGGVLVEWDGETLSVVSDPLLSDNLHAVIVDGPRPTVPPAPPSDVEGGVAERLPARVWVFGEGGALFRYDDVAWHSLPSGTRSDLRAATRLSDAELMAVGSGGLVQHYRGDQRATLSFGSDRNRMGLFRTPDGALWTFGDEVLVNSGAGWRPVTTGTSRSLLAGWGDDQGLWAVGTAGTVLRLSDAGSEDMSVPDLFGHLLRSVWGVGNSVWVVGDDGLSAVRAAGGWLPVPAAAGTDLRDVWGLAEDDLWAVGSDATTLHWNGSAWVAIPSSPDGQLVATLNAVWGSASDDVWAVGSLGTILHWNGGAWQPQGPGGTFTLNDVWGRSESDVYAVGTRGTVLHYDGQAFRALDSGTDASLEAVAEGPDGRIRIAGQNGALLVLFE